MEKSIGGEKREGEREGVKEEWLPRQIIRAVGRSQSKNGMNTLEISIK